MTTILNTDIVHEIYVNNDELYVLLEEPYTITSDVGERKVFVHEKSLKGFIQLNPTLRIYPYKYNAIRISPHPFMDEYNRIIDEYNNSEPEDDPDIPDEKPDEPIEPEKKNYSEITIFCDDPEPKEIKSIKDIIYRCKEDEKIDTNPKKVKFNEYDYKMFNELEDSFKKGKHIRIERDKYHYYYESKSNIDDHIFENGRHYSMKVNTNYQYKNIYDLIDNSKIKICVPKSREKSFKDRWKVYSDNINGIVVTSVKYIKRRQINNIQYK